jgi:hypothetical protein
VGVVDSAKLPDVTAAETMSVAVSYAGVDLDRVCPGVFKGCHRPQCNSTAEATDFSGEASYPKDAATDTGGIKFA